MRGQASNVLAGLQASCLASTPHLGGALPSPSLRFDAGSQLLGSTKRRSCPSLEFAELSKTPSPPCLCRSPSSFRANCRRRDYSVAPARVSSRLLHVVSCGPPKGIAPPVCDHPSMGELSCPRLCLEDDPGLRGRVERLSPVRTHH